jgi:hypothetical protein
MAEDVESTTTETGETEAPTEQQAAKSRTYTKAEVDAMLKKEGFKVRREYGDYGDLKTKAEEFDKLQEASRSQEEKLRTSFEKAVRERDAALTRAQNSIVRSAVISAASRAGAVDPEAVAALLPRDELVIEGDEVLGVEEAVKTLLAKKPYLRSQGAAKAGTEIAGGTAPAIITRSQLKEWAAKGELTDERQKEINAAVAAGRYMADR